MYWDLHVPYPATKQQATQMAVMAIKLGYDGIVWSRTVTGKLTPKDANNMECVDVAEVWRTHGAQQSLLRLKQPDYHMPSNKDKEDSATIAAAASAVAASAAVPAAAAAASSAAASSSSASAASASAPFPATSHGFGQKSRIHFVIEDAGQLHSLNPANATLQSYDVVSVFTSQEKLFHSCCSHESVDIVVVEASRKMPFYLKKPAINLALERGIHFEFAYAPAIRDAASRRYLFANVLSFLRLTRGRNLILSSAATREMEMRAPWDVINLGVMCGVDAATSKASISAYARSVLLHAEARKTIKCVLKEVKPPAETTAAAAGGHAKPTIADADQPKGKKGKFNK